MIDMIDYRYKASQLFYVKTELIVINFYRHLVNKQWGYNFDVRK